MRLRARRDLVEPAIVHTLERCGWSVLKVSAPNAPDLVIGRAGHTVLCECKTGRARLRDGQAEWHAHWRGGRVVILRTVDDVLLLR